MKKCRKCSRINPSEAALCWRCGTAFPRSDASEKRAFKRFRTGALLRYRVFEKESRASMELTMTRDISSGGVLFSTSRKLPVGANLEISLRAPTADGEVRTIARAVRVEEIVPGSWYSVGASFSRLESRDKAEIEKYVGHLEQRESY